MPKKFKKTQEMIIEAEQLLHTIIAIEGEKRVALACGDCGKIFARRYIPFATGQGLTVGACLCQLTANCRPTHEIVTMTP